MALEIKQLPLGDLTTNCYLAWCSKTRQAIVIDPADEGGFITEQILELQLEPQAIVLTHGHFDHVLGLLELKLNFGLPTLMSEKDVFLIEKAQQSARHWLGREVDPVPPPDAFLKKHESIRFGYEVLKVMETPGHTPGSICLYNEDVIFTGDTLFAEGIGSTDHGYSDLKLLQKSLEKLAKLPPDLLVCSGHGEVARLGEIQSQKAFLAS